MKIFERLEHFQRWVNSNTHIIEEISWPEVIELYDIFKDCNPNYKLDHVVEEHWEGDLVDEWNAFADQRPLVFKKFLKGRWMQRYVDGMKFKDFEEDLADEFLKEFYSHWPWKEYALEDPHAPNPWGAPWEWCGDETAKGETLREAAFNFWKENEAEIRELIEQEMRIEE